MRKEKMMFTVDFLQARRDRRFDTAIFSVITLFWPWTYMQSSAHCCGPSSSFNLSGVS
jgi:hypothetical protein